MLNRQEYMSKLINTKDQKIIKVITGVRRCGKSTLLTLFKSYLIENGVEESCCHTINFEDLRFEELKDYHKLYQFITDRLAPNKMNYIFLDEIQLVQEFQKAINSLFLRDDVDIYLTGSNAYMLSGTIATLLSGRYIEINMLPLSLKEFSELTEKAPKEAFVDFYKKGAFPYAATIANEDIRLDYLRGIYNTVLLKDIVERKNISDVPLLESIIRFLFDNIGNIVSTKKIADTLTSAGRKTTTATVSNYLQALKDAFILYQVNRFDIKGKQHLKSLEKYYIVDIGLRSLVLGERNSDVGHILENIVFLELIRRGYNVNIGKLNDLEIDFIASKGEERIYIQVSASVLDPSTYAREFAPLKLIKDNYPKYVLTMDELPVGEDGIKQMNIIEFLTQNSL